MGMWHNINEFVCMTSRIAKKNHLTHCIKEKSMRDMSINNLEPAAMVLGLIALELKTPLLKHMHLGILCDNTSAVSWAFKLRT